MSSDTIVAPATAIGLGGVAIVRLSGNKIISIMEQYLGFIPKARVATLTSFADIHNNIIDQGLVLFFPHPNSFTGEDVLELHCHGGTMITHLLIQRLLDFGVRLARPGEFSERAFLNGKIDLAQAEAIADMISASTERAALSAMQSLQGEFSKKIQTLLAAITQLRMYIEAAIDFVDEEINFLSQSNIKEHFITLIKSISDVQKQAQIGSLLREGIKVVISGKPNVGKSTLLNTLSGKDLAIVTDVPGTTRDPLHEHMHIDDLPLHIVDTAGLHETKDKIEQEGMRRAHLEMVQADLILFMIDNSALLESTHFDEIKETKTPKIIICNKIDLLNEVPHIFDDENRNIKVVFISAKNNLGIDLLKDTIKKMIGYTPEEGIFSARRRHLDAIARASSFINNAFQELQATQSHELIAEELRLSQQALAEITGEFSADDLLGKIFSSFCIGK